MKRLVPLSMLGATALLVAVHTAGAVPIPTLYYDFEETGGATVTNKGSLGGTGSVLGTGANLNSGGVGGSSTPGSGLLLNDDNSANGGRVATGYSAEQVGFRKNGSGATNYTASAWFSSAAVPTAGDNNDQMIFGQDVDGGGFLHHGIRDSSLHFGHWGNDSTAAAGTAVTNAPTHVAYTYTAGFSGIYKNGILLEGTYEARGGLGSNSEIIIGRTNAGNNRDFNGTLDDVAVYNTSLTLGQIIHLSNGGDPLAVNNGVVGPDGGDGFAGVRVVTGNGDISRVDRAIRSLGENEKLGLGTAFNATIPYLNLHDPQSNTGGSHNFAAGGSAISSAKLIFPGDTGADDNDFAMVINGTIRIDVAGTYTFGFAGDDGSQFILDGADFTKQGGGGGTAIGNAMVFREDTGDSETLASTFLTDGLHSFELIFNENGGGAFFELFAAQGIHTTVDGEFRIVGDVAFGGLALVARPQAVPEPATTLFGLLAMGALGIRRRRVA